MTTATIPDASGYRLILLSVAVSAHAEYILPRNVIKNCSNITFPKNLCLLECRDRTRSCRQIGKKKPLSRCYRKHNFHECCATCRRLKIDIPDCDYGDKQKWCSSIGKRYSVASCYDSQTDCCQTCHNLNTGIPGCPYGDKVQWCLHIGTIYGTDTCATNGNVTCCETCYKIHLESSTTVLPSLQEQGNTSGLPPGVHGHVVSSEEGAKNSQNTQPIPTSSSSSVTVTQHSAIMSQTISNAKSTKTNDTSHINVFSSSSPKPTSIPSLNEPQFPTEQSSLQTDDHLTERVSRFNKMAEFYVSITPGPRTTPSNIYSKNIKHIEDAPSPSSESIGQGQKAENSNKEEIFLSVEENESDIDSPLGQNNDNTDHAQHPVDREFEDLSRSDIDRFGGGILDTDDEDLLAEYGSGYFGHVGATSQHKERFAGDQHMGSAFAGTGHHNIYEQAEKDYVFEEYDVHGSAALPQLSLILASITQIFIVLIGS